jgi:iron complex transport system substrate-binding protein
MAVTWLTGVLYPQLTDIDLRQKTSEFYQLFYGVDLSAGQLDELLSDSSAK